MTYVNLDLCSLGIPLAIIIPIRLYTLYNKSAYIYYTIMYVVCIFNNQNEM